MTNNSKLTSFWNLVKEKNIVIPIIQRDYAQGRLGQEYLRERFLKQLLQALETKKALVLDFVYGSYENNILYPLDGQQRLTTLWLLHWYLSLCTGSLELDQEVLTHFSYATRISSRTFCEKLCSIKYEYNRKQVQNTIKKRILLHLLEISIGSILPMSRIPLFSQCCECLGELQKLIKTETILLTV